MLKRLICLTPVVCFFVFSSCNSTSTSASDNPAADSTTADQHPVWSDQSNIYEVNLRQYSGDGSFKSFAKSLPRLKEMGVEILWFIPINPIGLEGRKFKPAD